MAGLPGYLDAAWRASRGRIQPVATWVVCVQLLFWWHECGDGFYGKRAGDGGIAPSGATFQYDAGLRGLVLDAVLVLGGWRAARAILRGGAAIKQLHADVTRPERPVRAILLTE